MRSKIIKIKCLECKKEFRISPSRFGKRKFCSRKCWGLNRPKGIKRSEITKFKMSIWQIGRKMSPEARKKMSEIKKRNPIKYWLGKKRSKETIEKMRKANLGKKCSLETRLKYSMRRGKNAGNWKGGRTILEKIVRSCLKYRKWRSDIFQRDNYTCQICFQRSNYLEVDHYPKRFSIILNQYSINNLEEALACKELWNFNNGRTLCRKCHNQTKGKFKYALSCF